MSGLMMAWRRQEPGHQQVWCWSNFLKVYVGAAQKELTIPCMISLPAEGTYMDSHLTAGILPEGGVWACQHPSNVTPCWRSFMINIPPLRSALF